MRIPEVSRVQQHPVSADRVTAITPLSSPQAGSVTQNKHKTSEKDKVPEAGGKEEPL